MAAEPMLVDAEWPPPDSDGERPRFRLPRFRWPLLTVLFLAAGWIAPPLVAYICLILALYSAVETFALLLPGGDGLSNHHQ
jgi:hypothetical protein